jgi:hypothetical protein
MAASCYTGGGNGDFMTDFTIKQQRWGTFVSFDAEGKELVTSMTEELCREATVWYLADKENTENKEEESKP